MNSTTLCFETSCSVQQNGTHVDGVVGSTMLPNFVPDAVRTSVTYSFNFSGSVGAAFILGLKSSWLSSSNLVAVAKGRRAAPTAGRMLTTIDRARAIRRNMM